jgi:hypothetical protein
MKKTLLIALATLCAIGLTLAAQRRNQAANLFTGFTAIRFLDPAAPGDYGRAVTVWVMFPDDEPRDLGEVRKFLKAADTVVVDYMNGNDLPGTGIY